jgi:acetate kinase
VAATPGASPRSRRAVETVVPAEGVDRRRHGGVADKNVPDEARILAVNTGSSSLKVALYRAEQGSESLELRAEAERIGARDGRLRLAQGRGKARGWEQIDLPDHAVALVAVLERLQRLGHAGSLLAVGHRIVHGGSLYREPVRIGPELVDVLRGLVSVDPNHMPQALSAVEATGREFPSVPQVACFDTAFHARMPRVARLFALPRRLAEEGIIRYGFHGLSYEYVMDELRRIDPTAAEGRLVIAHLGNGASMAAVRGGNCVDTTMGFTPTGGLAMGTRSGDLDPGVLVHLLRSRRMEIDVLDALVNEESGLLGVSGTTSDMRDLLAREGEDRRAAEAVDLFCYVARKHLGALVAALGVLDTLVFTGGIGEHAAPVRERICAGLGFLGVRLDPDRNAKGEGVVYWEGSRVAVRVMPTDENLMVARHTRRLIAREGASDDVSF